MTTQNLYQKLINFIQNQFFGSFDRFRDPLRIWSSGSCEERLSPTAAFHFLRGIFHDAFGLRPDAPYEEGKDGTLVPVIRLTVTRRAAVRLSRRNLGSSGKWSDDARARSRMDEPVQEFD